MPRARRKLNLGFQHNVVKNLVGNEPPSALQNMKLVSLCIYFQNLDGYVDRNYRIKPTDSYLNLVLLTEKFSRHSKRIRGLRRGINLGITQTARVISEDFNTFFVC